MSEFWAALAGGLAAVAGSFLLYRHQQHMRERSHLYSDALPKVRAVVMVEPQKLDMPQLRTAVVAVHHSAVLAGRADRAWADELFAALRTLEGEELNYAAAVAAAPTPEQRGSPETVAATKRWEQARRDGMKSITSVTAAHHRYLEARLRGRWYAYLPRRLYRRVAARSTAD